ncbi:MAG: hypothetical protein ACO1OB_17975 [Archangium sp.]
MDLSAFFSGRIVRACVTAFQFRERGNLKPRAFENYFAGDPDIAWSEAKQLEALRSFGRVLTKTRVVELPEGVPSELIEDVVCTLAHAWDTIIARLRSEPEGGVDSDVAAVVLLREMVVDLSLRFAALAAMRGAVFLPADPSALQDSPAKLLRTLSGLTREEMVEHLALGDHAQVDKWLSGAIAPGYRNTLKLISLVAREGTLHDALFVRFGVATLITTLRESLGTELADELILTGWRFLHVFGLRLTLPNVRPEMLVELVQHGVWSTMSERLVDDLPSPSDAWRSLLDAVAAGDVSGFAVREGLRARFARAPPRAAEREAEEKEATRLAALGLKEALFTHLRDMRVKFPADVDVTTLCGAHHMDFESWTEAEALFREAIALQSASSEQQPWPWLSLAVLFWRQLRFADALSALDAMPAPLQLHAAVLHQRGQLLLAAKRERDAIDVLKQLCELQPDNVLAFDWLAMAELRCGRRRDALENARKAHRLGFSWTYVHLNSKGQWNAVML